MTKQIRIVLALPNAAPEMRLVPNTLEALQELVGEDISVFVPSFLVGTKLHAYANREALYGRALPPNCWYPSVRGLFVISKTDEQGNRVGLTESEAAFAVKALERGR